LIVVAQPDPSAEGVSEATQAASAPAARPIGED
jgi:hypothetical protein